jgi:hypothetical protein
MRLLSDPADSLLSPYQHKVRTSYPVPWHWRVDDSTSPRRRPSNPGRMGIPKLSFVPERYEHHTTMYRKGSRLPCWTRASYCGWPCPYPRVGPPICHGSEDTSLQPVEQVAWKASDSPEIGGTAPLLWPCPHRTTVSDIAFAKTRPKALGLIQLVGDNHQSLFPLDSRLACPDSVAGWNTIQPG